MEQPGSAATSSAGCRPGMLTAHGTGGQRAEIRARKQNSAPGWLPFQHFPMVLRQPLRPQTDVNLINEKLLEPLKVSLLKT